MTLTNLNQLFFKASKITNTSKTPTRFNVNGYPDPKNPNNFFDYKEFKRDFTFASYKDVVIGGILRCRLLFNKPYNDLELHKLNFGQNKQWFVSEIIAKGYSVKIDGEDHYPFLTISYSYDTVNVIKYDIGVYRSKCTNGVVFGYKSLLKLVVTPENFFDLKIWFNNCLLLAILKEYGRNVVILKRTKLDRITIFKLVNSIFRIETIEQKQYEGSNNNAVTNSISKKDFDSLSDKYTHEVGETGFTVLNIITDIATNYRLGNYKFDETENDNINNTVVSKQRIAGHWLDQIIRFTEHYNKIEVVNDFEDHQFGEKQELEEYKFDLNEFQKFVNNEKNQKND